MIGNAQSQSTPIPQEILERIASHTNGYVCCVLGLDLSLPHIRQCLFLSGGFGVALTEILSRGADPRALFTIKGHVSSDIAIAKAVIANDGSILRRVIAIWETNKSYDASMLALRRRDDYAMGILGDHSRCCVYSLNAYYFSRGMYERVDKTVDDPYMYLPRLGKLDVEISDEVLDMSTPLTRISILGANGLVAKMEEELSKSSIRDHWSLKQVVLRYAFENAVAAVQKAYEAIAKGSCFSEIGPSLRMQEDIPGIKVLIDFVFKGVCPEGEDVSVVLPLFHTLLPMVGEEAMLKVFSARPHAETAEIIQLIEVLGPRVFDGKWENIMRYYIHDKAPEIAICLHDKGLNDECLAMIEAGYDIVTGQDESLPVLYVRKLLGIYGEKILEDIHNIHATSVDDVYWLLLEMHDRFVIGEERRYGLCVEDGILYLPEEQMEIAYGEDTEENIWTSLHDIAACCHLYGTF